MAKPLGQALRINSELSSAHSLTGLTRLMLGDLPGAQAEFKREKNTLFSLPGLAIIAFRQGKQAEADAYLAELTKQHGDNSLYQRAQIMAQWNRKDEALGLLEQGYKAIDAGLTLMQSDPLVDPLRQDPRFIHLAELIGFG